MACLALATTGPALAGEGGASFDLAGPSLRATVTHEGVVLPLSQVPNISSGDRITLAAVLPADQGAHYRMVLAFLRGATNPPPKDWLVEARTWKPKEATIDAAVPEGAQQALVFLVPDTGGAFDAVAAAVRQRPGAFVRAAQDLSQAMLDRTRLETFLGHIRQRPADEVARVTPILAESLAVKLDPACLQKRQDPRAGCLTQGQNAAVLADGQTSSIAQTLAGAPANIALQLAATPQAGYGYYSAYIGVLRDVARMFGAFQSAQLQFIPALSVQREGETELLLNTVPSFRKPQSVLVAALPSVAPPALPPLEAKGDKALCLARPGLVLPVTGAPLAYSTDYAREMQVRVRGSAGVVERPVSADPARGGFVVADDRTAAPPGDAVLTGELHGRWGFAPFEGPRFRFVAPGAPWSAGEATLVAGRDTPVALTGGAGACVEAVRLERDGDQRDVPFVVENDARLALKVPLGDMKPGPLVLTIRHYGMAEPQRLKLRAYAEAGRIDGFVLHEGDARGVLSGTRLDQIASLDVSGVTFRPGALTRDARLDRLEMVADAADLRAGQAATAQATLTDGRSMKVTVTISPPRPRASLVSTSADPLAARAVPVTLSGAGLIPHDARVTFSLRAAAGTRFGAGDVVEVRTAAGSVRLPVRLQDEQVAVAVLEPAALGGSAHGALDYRLVQGAVTGDWQPLATLVRLPRLTGVSCAAARCTLRGTDLFLLRAAGGVAVPDGFTGSSITFPQGGALAVLVLRDAPQASATIALTDAAGS